MLFLKNYIDTHCFLRCLLVYSFIEMPTHIKSRYDCLIVASVSYISHHNLWCQIGLEVSATLPSFVALHLLVSELRLFIENMH